MLSSGRSEGGQPLLENHTRKGIVTIVVIAMSNLCAWSCISLLAPFFPIEAARKGTSDTVIGFIYSSSELVIFLMSPVFGKLLSSHSPRFFYIAGLCVFGTCDVMFGWLNQSPSGVPFISICFAVRIMEAIGTAAIMTSSYAIAGNTFPDRIGTVYGILETVVGCGFLIGPALGGTFYQQRCPFLFDSLVGLVFLSGFWAVVYSSVAVLPVLSFPHRTFNLSQSVIGLIFIIPAAAYTLTTPLWGLLLDKNVPPTPLISTGLCCAGVGLLFLGPAPFFTFLKPELWLNILALALLGLTLAPVIVSAMRCVVQGARDLGFKDESGTFGLVGGIVQSSTCLGTFVGPLLGEVLTEKFGFGWTMVMSAAMVILPVIVFSPFLLHGAHKQRRDRVITHAEKSLLLKGENDDNTNFYQTSSH